MLKGVVRFWLAVFSLLAFHAAGPAALAAIHQVFIRDDGFAPQTVNVVVGDTVQWVHDGSSFQSTTSDTGLWDSSILVRGETFDYTFSEEGTFNYHSMMNPALTGRVVVQSGFAITIVSPVHNARYNPGDDVNVQVLLSDPGALVTNIVLTAAATGTNIVLTNASTNPVFILEDLVEGAFTLTATGQSEGMNRTSAPITILVGDVDPVDPGPTDPPVITNIVFIAPNQVRISGTTTSSAPVDILASPSLDDVSIWVAIGSATPVGGSFEFTETLAPGGPARRFYRARVVGGGGGGGAEPEITAFQRLANGQFQITVTTGRTGQHTIQASSNLSGANWATVGTATPTGGNFTFTDADAPANARRFYRILAP